MSVEKTIKCTNCNYTGPGERGRTSAGMTLAWIGLLITPFIPIIYFLATSRYRCPKCKSTFLGIQNSQGVFAPQKKGPVVIILGILMGLGLLAIMAAVVIVAINPAGRINQASSSFAIQSVNVIKEQTKLPKRLDSKTTWTDVAAEGNTIRFLYVLNDFDTKGISSEYFKSFMKSDVCGSEAVNTMFDHGLSVEYFYTVQGSAETFLVSYTKADCK